MAATLTIGALVEAATAIATLVSETGDIVDKIQPRKKVPAEQVDDLKTKVKGLEESKQRIGQVAATLGAYVRNYVDVSPIATKCERLLVYLRENRARLGDADADDAWSVVYFIFRDIDHDANKTYRVTTLDQTGSLDQEDLGYIRASVDKFERATNQARTCIEHKWAGDLMNHVEDMDEASRTIPNVLERRINSVLGSLARLG